MLDPLPQLHASDLSGRSVLHQVVERDAAVSAHPGCGVSKRGCDVLADTFGSDLAWYVRVQEIGSSNSNVLAKPVILYHAHISCQED
jgi:hypothetical protein